MRSAPCGSATLSPLATATPPALLISLATACATPRSLPSPSAAPPRSLTTTLPPSAAASRAISRPMPRPAPVTTMTLPSTHLLATRRLLALPRPGHGARPPATLPLTVPLTHTTRAPRRPGRTVISFIPRRRANLSAVFSDDGNGGDVALGKTTEVVGQTKHWLLRPLTLAGAALHLQVHLVDHTQTRGADRVAEALEAAVDLTGNLAVGIIEAVEHVLDGAAFGRDVQILHGDELGHRKAIVHLDQAQLLARLVDACLLVGALGGHARGRKVAAVPGVVLRFQAVGDGHLQGLDRN